MIVDGREIAENVYARIREKVSVLERPPVLAIVTCAPNFETRRYLALKEKQAAACGIETRVVELPEMSRTEEVVQAVDAAAQSADGLIVQLPLPSHIDTEMVVRQIPSNQDVDALNPETHTFHSPVVGACKEILETHGVVVKDKLVTVIGGGRLVGAPASRWFMEQGAHVSVVTKDTVGISYYTKNADIIVCGAGVPALLAPAMIKDGVIVLDAGTSEEGGELRGDADPQCAEKAAIFTPVPGGIGPITIAILLEHVVDCVTPKQHVV